MSAQYLVSFNGTDQIEILSENQFSEGAALDEESQTKQKEALYYIVAVITFYALTFMLLFCKYARFKKKEMDDSIPYFPLPPDLKSRRVEEDHVALRKYGPRDNYGSNGVTAKAMRVKMLPQHWLCRRENTNACDV
ncbi:hypothetical protein ACOMHN_058062 [Nucella lapillus]